ncbi:MAG: sigma-70 family RNA polymerase sigma factor [Myxococcales bacterium]|nr:sigma-70 family RNA polymerase sigma factor [Myxococcales bacterium]MCB9732329.1 sigma-70 family RNA polymerase sigma factor [Deltaproteobacteria bacterium]
MAWLSRRDKRPTEELSREFLATVFVHWEGLYRYALRLTGSPDQAEDLVQEALTKAFTAYERLREDTRHRAWVFTILRNTFLSKTRKSGREAPLDDAELVPDLGADPVDDVVVRAEDGFRHGFEDEVLEALQALPEAHRTAVVLCDVEGLSYDEIAVVLECPIGTVRSRIHHARRRLRQTLAGYATARGYDDVEHAG